MLDLVREHPIAPGEVDAITVSVASKHAAGLVDHPFIPAQLPAGRCAVQHAVRDRLGGVPQGVRRSGPAGGPAPRPGGHRFLALCARHGGPAARRPCGGAHARRPRAGKACRVFARPSAPASVGARTRAEACRMRAARGRAAHAWTGRRARALASPDSNAARGVPTSRRCSPSPWRDPAPCRRRRCRPRP